MARSIYYIIIGTRRWDSLICLDALAKFEVEWWSSNIRSVAKYPICNVLSSTPASINAESGGSRILVTVHTILLMVLV